VQAERRTDAAHPEPHLEGLEFAVVAAQKLEIEYVANTMKPDTSAAARHTT